MRLAGQDRIKSDQRILERAINEYWEKATSKQKNMANPLDGEP